MHWKSKESSDWQRVPFAWLPVDYDGTTYWLERPPFMMRCTYCNEWWAEYEFMHVDDWLTEVVVNQ